MIFIGSGCPPFRVPLLMIATRGCIACARTGEFEMFRPWCETIHRSTMPRRFCGHIRSNSLFQVRSPRCTALNLPNVIWLPTDCAFSLLSTSWGLKAEQYGFGFPDPYCSAFKPQEVD